MLKYGPGWKNASLPASDGSSCMMELVVGQLMQHVETHSFHTHFDIVEPVHMHYQCKHLPQRMNRTDADSSMGEL